LGSESFTIILLPGESRFGAASGFFVHRKEEQV
jgi:hypothetical protein